MSQSLINQGNILTETIKCTTFPQVRVGVAIPYKSGKYSYKILGAFRGDVKSLLGRNPL